MMLRVKVSFVTVIVWLGAGLAPAADSVRLSVVSQVFSDEGRSLTAVLAKLDEAAAEGADLVLLPQECVLTKAEAVPGPTSAALCVREGDQANPLRHTARRCTRC